jgi:hypothetical protein
MSTIMLSYGIPDQGEPFILKHIPICLSQGNRGLVALDVATGIESREVNMEKRTYVKPEIQEEKLELKVACFVIVSGNGTAPP